MTGPSGVGKGYQKDKIKEKYPFLRELTWITTRPLRPGESPDCGRKTVSAREFQNYRRNERLMVVQDLFGYSYGLEGSVLLEAIECPDICWTEFHIDNLVMIAGRSLGIVALALIPSDIALLRRRLNERAGSSPEDVEKRIAAAQIEIDKIKRYRGLFSKIIEICPGQEDEVFPQVLNFLRPYFCLKSREEVPDG